MIKNIKAFISQTNLNKSIEGVLVTPTHIVATDSFKLIEIQAETNTNEQFIARPPKALKTFEKVYKENEQVIFEDKGTKYIGELIQDNYPDYNSIIPTGEPTNELFLTAEHLQEICIAMADKSKRGLLTGIKMSIYEKGKVIVFTNKLGDKKALLMPRTEY